MKGPLRRAALACAALAVIGVSCSDNAPAESATVLGTVIDHDEHPADGQPGPRATASVDPGDPRPTDDGQARPSSSSSLPDGEPTERASAAATEPQALDGDIVFHGVTHTPDVVTSSTRLEDPAEPSARADPRSQDVSDESEELSCEGWIRAGERVLLVVGTVRIDLIVDNAVVGTRTFDLDLRLDPGERWEFSGAPSHRLSIASWQSLRCDGSFTPARAR